MKTPTAEQLRTALPTDAQIDDIISRISSGKLRRCIPVQVDDDDILIANALEDWKRLRARGEGIHDEELADAIVWRLNGLISHPDVRTDIARLIEARVPHSAATRDHPTIQVGDGVLGVLGLLNGIVGTVPAGKRKGWGFIAAMFDDDDRLVRFERTDREAARG